jgi:hypothetical protein
VTTRIRPLAVVACLAVGAVGAWLAEGRALEPWYLAFIVLAGFCSGSLGLLTIGHLLSEEWLAPIRSEAEAAALTAPLLAATALPLGLHLAELYPWAEAAGPALPPGRDAYLGSAFFVLRAVLYLVLWNALAVWIARTPHLRRASAIAVALLAPTMTLAANDWVLSREPLWWSSLFGFGFTVNQLLAALAGAILISLLRPEHPTPERMQSLERALLTLALIVLWTWFAHFLIVWLANLPDESAWYLARSGPWLWLLAVAALTLVAAVAMLVPPGVGRRTMIAGSALLLVQHAAHMLWLLGPRVSGAALSLSGAAVLVGLAVVWGAWFVIALRARPTYAEERGEPPQRRPGTTSPRLGSSA